MSWRNIAVMLFLHLAVGGTVLAYPDFNGCRTCHNYLANPYAQSVKGTFPTSLHELHRSSTYMNSDCGLCHTAANNGDVPKLNSSRRLCWITGFWQKAGRCTIPRPALPFIWLAWC